MASAPASTIASATSLEESNGTTPELSSLDHPLSPGQFRLFYLESAFPETRHGRLEVFNIKDAPTFKALSYACGKPYRVTERRDGRLTLLPDEACHQAADIPVNAGRRTVNIIENLFNALNNLVERAITGWIWVDALCIQQDDLKERAAQVAFMGQIYTQAEEVLVWLGHELALTGPVVKLINELTPALLKVDDDDLHELHGTGLYSCEERFGVTSLVQNVTYFVLFTSVCRWFQRFWVAQEFLLAKRPRLFWGSHELKWALLDTLFHRLLFFDWMNIIITKNLYNNQWDVSMRQGTGDVPRLTALLNMSASFDECDMLAPIPSRIPGETPKLRAQRCDYIRLTSLFSFMRRAICSDARDRIYAVMGIAEKFAGIDLVSLLNPDYVRSFEDLYRSVTTLLLRKSKSLDLLTWAHKAEGLEQSIFPSWVPDYRNAHMQMPLFSKRSFDDRPYNAAKGFHEYRDIHWHTEILEIHETTLIVQGLRFDVVEAAQVLWSQNEKMPSFMKILEFGVCLESERCGGRPLEVIWRSCITNNFNEMYDLDSRPFPLERSFLAMLAMKLASDGDQEGLSLEEWKTYFARAMAVLAQYTLSDRPEDQFEFAKAHEMFLELRQDDPSLRTEFNHAGTICVHYERHYNYTAFGRPIFVTERGLFGVGSHHMQVGDQIWVLAGAHTPYVLRPTGAADEYRVVGDCYLIHHMHGEILSERYGLAGTQQKIKII